jgi:hypothetical protein
MQEVVRSFFLLPFSFPSFYFLFSVLMDETMTHLGFGHDFNVREDLEEFLVRLGQK